MSNLFTLFLVCSLSVMSFAQDNSNSESIEYDPVGNRFLLGSDDISIIQSDLLGNLSYFGEGLTAHYGMEIVDNYLFCIVSLSQSGPANTINVYDLETELQVSTITIDGAQFLNGMTSNGDSKIWVSGFQNQEIHEVDFSDLSNPTTQVVANSSSIPNIPNGLKYDASQNRLVILSWNDGHIRQLDLSDNSVSILLENSGISQMDGIDTDNDGSFYVSSWSPMNRITKYSSDFVTEEVLDIPGLATPADLCVGKELNVLAIPSQQRNVIYWDVSTPILDLEFVMKDNNQYSTSPNPTRGDIDFKISSDNWQEANCQIFDVNERLIRKYDYVNNGVDNFKIDLTSEQSGNYLLKVMIDKERCESKIIKVIR